MVDGSGGNSTVLFVVLPLYHARSVCFSFSSLGDSCWSFIFNTSFSPFFALDHSIFILFLTFIRSGFSVYIL